ncbi:hypothetical protein THIOM_002222 [Candidatus Thiomargarita nelsonii]|uniref:Uncharacterized protein n=1 Tax=Candidatus Thiomargarita nelsonii TaxID=1003181 RepID=A0A176S1V4_9GAMM|nr:hypothetical protein THIOM_002222 [Candidatus Thiomargarita nelsonii]
MCHFSYQILFFQPQVFWPILMPLEFPYSAELAHASMLGFSPLRLVLFTTANALICYRFRYALPILRSTAIKLIKMNLKAKFYTYPIIINSRYSLSFRQ